VLVVCGSAALLGCALFSVLRATAFAPFAFTTAVVFGIGATIIVVSIALRKNDGRPGRKT
jgi:hypothetical protein